MCMSNLSCNWYEMLDKHWILSVFGMHSTRFNFGATRQARKIYFHDVSMKLFDYVVRCSIATTNVG